MRTLVVDDAIAEAKSRALLDHRKGDELREKGEWEKATYYYRSAIQLNSDFSWSHHSLGDCCRYRGDWQGAITAYRQAVLLNGEFVWSHYSLGEALEQMEEWTAAVDCYRRVRELAPKNEQVLPRLAVVLRALITEEPRRVQHYRALAEVLLSEGKIGEAIATYQMALQIRPDDSSVALALSKVLSTQDPEQVHLMLDRSSARVVTYRDIHSLDSLRDVHIVSSLLSYTHLFDADYYRTQHKDLSELGYRELLLHYITEGSAADYQPNPLFDGAFYRREYSDACPHGVNPLAHYHCFGYATGYDPHPLFSTEFYYQTHPDVAVAEVDPLEHYLSTGAKEGRAAFAPERCANLLQQPVVENAEYSRPCVEASAEGALQTIGVYCSSLGNYFITEIADFIAAALTKAGHSVVRLSEQDTPPENLDGHWVVAPHEFFYLGDGEQWAQKRGWLSEVVMVNVEQPQTTWFSKAFHFFRNSKIIFDINVKSSAMMQQLGLPAHWLPLGHLEDYAPFSAKETLPDLRAIASLPDSVRHQLPEIEAPLTERPLDIHFIGTLNKRRELFFAKSARWLSEYRCLLHMPPMGVPFLKGEDQALDTAAAIGISRRSKILLNIHRDDMPYFEWHRMIFHGLWQNTLVMTEPCHEIPGLMAGEHFVACELDEMAQKVEWLLRSPEGQLEAERIRLAGYQAFRSLFNSVRIMANALQLIEAALSQQEVIAA